MAEQIGVNVDMTGLSEAVAGLTAVSHEMAATAAAAQATARAGGAVAKGAKDAADAEKGFFDTARARGREAASIGRVMRGGAMLGMMGVQAGLQLTERAFGEGPGGGAVRTAGGIIGGTMTGAMGGAMIGGPLGAAIGGGIGLVSSSLNAIFASMETQSTNMAEKFAMAADQAARLVDTASALSQSWGLMGDQLRGGGTDLRGLSESVGILSEATKAPQAVIVDLINSISDRAVDAASVTNALRESQMKAMTDGIRTLGLSTDQMAEVAIAADKARVPVDLFIQMMLNRGREAVRMGRAETVSEYARSVAGGMSVTGSPMQVAAASMLGPGFSAVTQAIAEGGATPEQIAARQRLGVTAGMGAEQSVATLASAVAGGGSLAGTGLERFGDVLGQFGAQAEDIKALAGVMVQARITQEAVNASNARIVAAAAENTAALRAVEEGLSEIAGERAEIAAEAERRQSHEANREIVGPRR